jgi:hypothetical protein
MASDCGDIAADINRNCEDPLILGVQDDIYLINFSDWEEATVTRDGTNPKIITNIVMGSGGYAYKMSGFNNSPGHSHTSKKSAYGYGWEHKISYLIFDLSPATKAVIDEKNQGKYVAIVINNYKGTSGNAAIEVLGTTVGLSVPDGGIVRDSNSADNDGAYAITMQTNLAKGKEPGTPDVLFVTSYAASKAILDSLLLP